jgi:hypothetical protein
MAVAENAGRTLMAKGPLFIPSHFQASPLQGKAQRGHKCRIYAVKAIVTKGC